MDPLREVQNLRVCFENNYLSTYQGVAHLKRFLRRRHCNLFILVFNQLDAQNLFYNKFYFTPLHVSSTCAHHQEVKIALSLVSSHI